MSITLSWESLASMMAVLAPSLALVQYIMGLHMKSMVFNAITQFQVAQEAKLELVKTEFKSEVRELIHRRELEFVTTTLKREIEILQERVQELMGSDGDR